MIAQGFGFTRDFLKERNNSAYFRLKKIPCEFKEQARAHHPGEKCGLPHHADCDPVTITYTIAFSPSQGLYHRDATTDFSTR